jgi:hypothetical protein
MAPDERDRSFDKALARHLRSAAPAGQAAEIPGAFASQGGACPDPETLAAYHERSLLPEQLNSLKEHLVGCANCQTVLAHLETTDEIPLQAAQEGQVSAQTSSARVVSASSQTQAPSEALPVKSRRARLLRGARWQWLAPAGAIAAGLLVWIALHEHQPLHPALSEGKHRGTKPRAACSPSFRFNGRATIFGTFEIGRRSHAPATTRPRIRRCQWPWRIGGREAEPKVERCGREAICKVTSR